MKKLDDLKLIESKDRSRMRNILQKLPLQCQEAFRLGKNFSISQEYSRVKNIVFSGMGGSAIGADLISFYLRKEIKLPIYVNRDYSLPAFLNQDSLAILLSYSGNTEETLSSFERAEAASAKILVISSGGKLVELAKKNNHPYLVIPAGYPPRGALAFLFFPSLAILSGLGFIEDKQREFQETITLLEKMHDNSLDLGVPESANPAKKLAARLFNKFAVIYGASENLAGVVTRWRGQLAENSKSLASSQLLPEMNHNEIVGWQHPEELLQRFVIIFLRDEQDHPQVKKRIEISKEILQKQGFAVEEIHAQGKGLLARVFSLIYLGDYVSFYLAILNGEDPTPVKRIDYLKQRLRDY
ncbi:MAG: bifunctional phosphoglucose/phosphomannose isomerase [Candidatus Omnitrophica bacterium]|nr:bifunctional phosphoglucose/phosphomannose isomerase [Candidatus Omnitrophota bacterium]